MPLPTGVTSATAFIKAPVSFGGTPGRVFLEVVSNMRLTHIASGTPIANFIDVRHPADGLTAEVLVPHTDQGGFQDDSGTPVTNWSYKATIVFELDGQMIQVADKNFSVLVGQNTVDLALIPVGTATEPIFGNVAFVSSVNTRTGAVVLTKTDVGLSNVDNTSDANKPTSTAVSTALSGKEPTITAGTSAQYWRGDKTWQTLDKASVGLSAVDNTSDANKPVSTATTTALNLKAPLASPTFTGTVTLPSTTNGLTKSNVGLGNVDNTSDANKPISTATQTALDAKVPYATTVVTLTAGATLTASQDLVFISGASAITVSLPDPGTVTVGREYIVKGLGSATHTVNSAGTSKTIDGGVSVTLATNARLRVVSNGTQWYRTD